MIKNDGGPAFPVKDSGEFYSGASLRDVFAWQALPIAAEAEARAPTYGDEATYRGIAERAYLMADALLAERAKGGIGKA